MILLDDVLTAVPDGVVLHSGATHFPAAAVDSRRLAGGELFFAVAGPERDGHDFLAQALRAGAGGLVVSRADAVAALAPLGDVAVLAVPDTLKALQRMAAQVRRRADPTLVAVTGSAGKTTTKTLIAAALAVRFDVLTNAASFNNHLGVPLTLSGIGPQHTHVVAELGSNHPGEIPELARLVAPDVAVVTKVGMAHLGNFADRVELAEEKSDLLRCTRPDGTWVLNGDDPLLLRAAARLPQATTVRIVTVGYAEGNRIRVEQVDVGRGGTTGVLVVGDRRYPFSLALTGRHFGYALMQAVAVAETFGITPETTLEALREVPSPPGRARPIPVDDALLVIDDTYNGSPDAMLAAAALLADLDGELKIAVLGQMGELGRFSQSLHDRVGRAFAASATHVVTVGDDAEPLRLRAAQDLPDGRTHRAGSAAEALAVVQQLLAGRSGTSAVVVAKGSRFTHMERVPLGLTAGPTGCARPRCPRSITCADCPDLPVA
jgi:UDP-N-acetylmuramoyl-tripeptide--D-alanyl-D-alanine ligase